MTQPAGNAPPPRNAARGSREAFLLWAGLFLVFLLLYGLTTQRGVSWQDSGMFQWRMVTADYAGTLGLALAHPLYIALGRFLIGIPAGDFLLKINLLSAIGGAATLASLGLLARTLTGRLWIGIVTAAILSVTHALWWLSTIAEVYTLHAALFTVELLLLVKLNRTPRWSTAFLLTFVNGLNWSVHNLALLALPVYACAVLLLVVRRRLPPRTLPAAAAGFLIGAAPFLWMIGHTAAGTGDLTGAVHSALYGEFAPYVLNTGVGWGFAKVNIALAALNLAGFALLLVFVGWWHMRRRLGTPLALAIGAITLIEILFYVRYPVPDQFTFILPTLIMTAVGMSIGISVLAERSHVWRNIVVTLCLASIVVPPLVYAGGPALITRLGLDVKRERERPFRNEMRYWIVPWKHNELSAEQFASSALEQAGPNGIVACDGTAYYPLLLYQKRERIEPGVSVVLSLADSIGSDEDWNAQLRRGSLYTVLPLEKFLPPGRAEEVDFIRGEGEVLYRVSAKRFP